MPHWVMQFKTLFQLQTFNGPFSLQSLPLKHLPAGSLCRSFPHCISCVICERAGIKQHESITDSQSVWLCISCRCVWHNQCARCPAYNVFGVVPFPSGDDDALSTMGQYCPFCKDTLD